MATHMAGIAATGEDMPPMPARRGAWAIYEVFPCADGELFIGVTSDQQWTRFTEEFGLQALAADPRLATNVMRVTRARVADPRAEGGHRAAAQGRGRRAAGALQRARGRPSASPATCSRTPTCWRPAA